MTGAATGNESVAAARVASSSLVQPLLVLQGVGAAYGPYQALFDVTFTVGTGRALALVGYEDEEE